MGKTPAGKGSKFRKSKIEISLLRELSKRDKRENKIKIAWLKRMDRMRRNGAFARGSRHGRLIVARRATEKCDWQDKVRRRRRSARSAAEKSLNFGPRIEKLKSTLGSERADLARLRCEHSTAERERLATESEFVKQDRLQKEKAQKPKRKRRFKSFVKGVFREAIELVPIFDPHYKASGRFIAADEKVKKIAGQIEQCELALSRAGQQQQVLSDAVERATDKGLPIYDRYPIRYMMVA